MTGPTDNVTWGELFKIVIGFLTFVVLIAFRLGALEQRVVVLERVVPIEHADTEVENVASVGDGGLGPHPP